MSSDTNSQKGKRPQKHLFPASLAPVIQVNCPIQLAFFVERPCRLVVFAFPGRLEKLVRQKSFLVQIDQHAVHMAQMFVQSAAHTA